MVFFYSAPRKVLAMAIGFLLILSTLQSEQAESKTYHVSVQGSDQANGTSRDRAFASVQRGLDALNPGDTLVIGPGEYCGAFERGDVGAAGTRTTIRAEVAGTVLLRGDIDLPTFRKTEGHRFIYETKFKGNVQAVNEVDTLRRFAPSPNLDELEFMPARFYHDVEAGVLYISSSDFRPANEHRYTACVTPLSGLVLLNPSHVTIEGLAFTGYNISEAKSLRATSQQGTVWGLWMDEAAGCVVRNCTAYLNSGGIAVQSRQESGGNLVEDCLTYANGSFFVAAGGVHIYGGNNDTIRNCFNYGPGGWAFRYYGSSSGPSIVEDCIALQGSMQTKGTNLAEFGRIRRTVGLLDVASMTVEDVVIGRANRYRNDEGSVSENAIYLSGMSEEELAAEFADPLNGDFRLQSSSKFRGKGANGSDLGAYPFRGDVYFLRPDGNDAADGLSVGTAWKTLDHALQNVRPGQTIYLMEGSYEMTDPLVVEATAEQPFRLLGRGRDQVKIGTPAEISGSSHVRVERIQWSKSLVVESSREVVLASCRWAGEETGLSARKVDAMQVLHGFFAGFTDAGLMLKESGGVFLAGNIFNNLTAPAVVSDSDQAIIYSGYNGYAKAPDRPESSAWVALPQFSGGPGWIELDNEVDFVGRGPLGTPLGPYRRNVDDSLEVLPLELHAVTATTANLEWWTSHEALCVVAWGETPDCVNEIAAGANGFGTVSLTGLKPNTQYFYTLRSAQLRDETSPDPDGEEQSPDGEAKFAVRPAQLAGQTVQHFTTSKQDAPGRVYHVSTKGDNRNDGLSPEAAWRTVTHAASRVRPGDTVLIAAGEYPERIRIRSSGTADAPIVFRGEPDGKTFLTGGGKKLSNSFVISNKDHIHIDHLRFKEMNPSGGSWRPWTEVGVFLVINSRGVRLTRCFYDGRNPGISPSYSPYFMWSDGAEDFLMENCVLIRPASGMYVSNSINSIIRNNVFFQSMIVQMGFDGPNTGGLLIANNIFTDNLHNKVTAGLLAIGQGREGIEIRDNVFFLRLPYLERASPFFHRSSPYLPKTDEEKNELAKQTRSLFINPDFALAVAKKDQVVTDRFLVDEMQKLPPTFEFTDFFATDPEVLERGIGLQPEAFSHKPSTSHDSTP